MEAATQPQASAKPPAHMLNEVSNSSANIFVCSDQQAALLAVWVLHTWCYRAFPVTPYLNIQSPGPQSGKTLCLRLLQLLSPPGSWYISSPASTPFMKKLLALNHFSAFAGETAKHATLPAELSVMAGCWQHPCFGVSAFVSALFRRFFAKSPINMRFVSAFRRLGSVWQKTGQGRA